MLKIKDDVDLKKLGKDYNLEFYEYEEMLRDINEKNNV